MAIAFSIHGPLCRVRNREKEHKEKEWKRGRRREKDRGGRQKQSAQRREEQDESKGDKDVFVHCVFLFPSGWLRQPEEQRHPTERCLLRFATRPFSSTKLHIH